MFWLKEWYIKKRYNKPVKCQNCVEQTTGIECKKGIRMYNRHRAKTKCRYFYDIAGK